MRTVIKTLFYIAVGFILLWIGINVVGMVMHFGGFHGGFQCHW